MTAQHIDVRLIRQVSRDRKGVFSEVRRKPGECDAREAERKIFEMEGRVTLYVKCSEGQIKH